MTRLAHTLIVLQSLQTFIRHLRDGAVLGVVLGEWRCGADKPPHTVHPLSVRRYGAGCSASLMREKPWLASGGLTGGVVTQGSWDVIFDADPIASGDVSRRRLAGYLIRPKHARRLGRGGRYRRPWSS